MIIDYLSDKVDSRISDMARGIVFSPQRTRNLLNIRRSGRLIALYGTDNTERYHIDKSSS